MRIISSSVALLLFAVSGCASVGPGQAGVLWTASNGTEDAIYGEGLYPVAKWNKMYVYDLKTMNQDETMSAITVNGLALTLGTSLRYRLVPNDVIAVHKQIGQDYYKKLVRPSLLAETRRIFSQYTPEQIYSTKRTAIEREVREAVSSLAGGRYVTIERFLIREVELPLAIRAAIDQKLVTEQQLRQMTYKLALAKASAEQKQIEARSTAESNNTVRASLSQSLLEYERVQGMSQIARSTNAKTVVVGPGSGSVQVETRSNRDSEPQARSKRPVQSGPGPAVSRPVLSEPVTRLGVAPSRT